jgi:hypothetical protein
LWNIFWPPLKQEDVKPSGERGIPIDQTPMGRLYLEMEDHCPDCRKRPPSYREGPSAGGISTNIFCADCGAGFNITPVIQIAERIGVNRFYIQRGD